MTKAGRLLLLQQRLGEFTAIEVATGKPDSHHIPEGCGTFFKLMRWWWSDSEPVSSIKSVQFVIVKLLLNAEGVFKNELKVTTKKQHNWPTTESCYNDINYLINRSWGLLFGLPYHWLPLRTTYSVSQCQPSKRSFPIILLPWTYSYRELSNNTVTIV